MISVYHGILDITVVKRFAFYIRQEVDFDPATDFETFFEKRLDLIQLNDPRLIQCAATLAHRDLLGDLSSIGLGVGDIWTVGDLSTVPTHHLVSLVSSVTSHVHIKSVTGCDLVAILDSLECEKLLINKQKLGRDETQALLRAMETRVEDVFLTNVDIDIKALTEYSGQGRCRYIQIASDTEVKFTRVLVRWVWANKKEWNYSFIREIEEVRFHLIKNKFV